MPERYSIQLLRGARKDLNKLDGQIAKRIASAIDALADDPRPHGCIKILASDSLWRIRVGDWRVGYKIEDENHVVLIVKLGHRSEFYA